MLQYKCKRYESEYGKWGVSKNVIPTLKRRETILFFLIEVINGT